MDYHIPVMLNECIEGLNIKPDGIYVDVTFGGGGHSKQILKNLDKGHLYAFDQDQEAKLEAKKIESKNFSFINANFRHLTKYLRLEGVKKVDGILADFGVSSHQIDTPERGFSTRYEAELDMRMNRSKGLTAKEVINTYDGADLHKIFGIYGELKNAKTTANAIVESRSKKPINTIFELKEVLGPYAPRNRENKYFAQVFQALRIEVNEELKVIEEFLIQTPELLREGGRLVTLSYHSLEDRLVKNFIRYGNFNAEKNTDFYGNIIRPLEPITRKPLVASSKEIALNPRARSAKLRIAEKVISA